MGRFIDVYSGTEVYPSGTYIVCLRRPRSSFSNHTLAPGMHRRANSDRTKGREKIPQVPNTVAQQLLSTQVLYACSNNWPVEQRTAAGKRCAYAYAYALRLRLRLRLRPTATSSRVLKYAA